MFDGAHILESARAVTVVVRVKQRWKERLGARRGRTGKL